MLKSLLETQYLSRNVRVAIKPATLYFPLQEPTSAVINNSRSQQYIRLWAFYRWVTHENGEKKKTIWGLSFVIL
jgi:hypothetical protein